MNRKLLLGIAVFLAVAGIALMGGEKRAVAGHGCHGLFGGGGHCGGIDAGGGCRGGHALFRRHGCHGLGKGRCHGLGHGLGKGRGHGLGKGGCHGLSIGRCHGAERCQGRDRCHGRRRGRCHGGLFRRHRCNGDNGCSGADNGCSGAAAAAPDCCGSVGSVAPAAIEYKSHDEAPPAPETSA